MKTRSSEHYDISLLYVEDERVTREQISRILQRIVTDLHVAENGQQGLELYQEKRPDIILSDIMMPVMNGLEMIRRIRELDNDIPIIITTAYDDEAHACPLANRVILKPIRFMDLVQAVEECVATKEG